MPVFNVMIVVGKDANHNTQFEVVDTLIGPDVHAALLDDYPPEFFLLSELSGIYHLYGRDTISHLLTHPPHLAADMRGDIGWQTAYIERVG